VGLRETDADPPPQLLIAGCHHLSLTDRCAAQTDGSPVSFSTQMKILMTKNEYSDDKKLRFFP
jgi:hypothetical protein